MRDEDKITIAKMNLFLALKDVSPSEKNSSENEFIIGLARDEEFSAHVPVMVQEEKFGL